MELYRSQLKPSDIITEKSFENALRTEMAIGCSTNTVLHLTAIAYEMGVPLDIDMIDKISRSTPQICKLNPASQVFITDLNEVGGIPAVMTLTIYSLSSGTTRDVKTKLLEDKGETQSK